MENSQLALEWWNNRLSPEFAQQLARVWYSKDSSELISKEIEQIYNSEKDN